MIVNKRIVEFEWDGGNAEKNWIRHKVSAKECEEVFFDTEKREYPDPKHCEKEPRKVITGKTKKERLLFIVYTVRNKYIRIISARDLNKRKEANLYEKATEAA